jgi:hypothetical protein
MLLLLLLLPRVWVVVGRDEVAWRCVEGGSGGRSELLLLQWWWFVVVIVIVPRGR